jgi:hypothetical protein
MVSEPGNIQDAAFHSLLRHTSGFCYSGLAIGGKFVERIPETLILWA